MTTLAPALLQNGLPVTTSPTAVVVQILRWTKRPAVEASESLATINVRLNAGRDEFLRLAELNTIKLTGKPRL